MDKIKFNDLDISNDLKRAIKDIGFEDATAIQSQSIPLILDGHDIIGHSQTGSGKTAAFGLPAIDMVDTDISRRIVQILVLCPTRELAVQACEEIKKFAKYKSEIRAVPIYGGQPIERQLALLKQGCQIVIGTPGRVMDHMRRKTLKLDNIKMIILDEADEMLNMGFKEDIETILQDTPAERQTVLFSATMPLPILEITKKFQKNPQMVRIENKQMAVSTIEQFYYEVPKGRKTEALCRLMDAHEPKLAMVFCNTKKMVDELVEALQSKGYQADGLHGDMKQTSRTQVMNRFKSGVFNILVATDVAARGIDVNNIEAVFNYDLPQDPEYYVHRIGRTGRAGKNGTSLTLVQGRTQTYQLRDIIRYTKGIITHKALPSLTEVRAKRIEKFLNEVHNFIETNDISAYNNIITSLEGDKYTSEDVAAALVAMTLKLDNLDSTQPDSLTVIEPQYDFRSSSSSYDRDNSQRTSAKVRRVPNDRNDRRGDFERRPFKEKVDAADMSKIRISVGRNDKITPNHILGAIAGESNLPGSIVGNISIQPSYTTVEIPKEHRNTVINSLNNGKIKGIKVTVV